MIKILTGIFFIRFLHSYTIEDDDAALRQGKSSSLDLKYSMAPPAGMYNSVSQPIYTCDANCENCINSSIPQEFCIKCKDNFEAWFGRCLKICPIGFYRHGDRCRACNFGCGRCTGTNVGDCYECLVGYILNNQGFCSWECPTGYYSKSRIKECFSEFYISIS